MQSIYDLKVDKTIENTDTFKIMTPQKFKVKEVRDTHTASK